MSIVRLHCGNSFEGDNEKFYNNGCKDSHITLIEKRVKEATENDWNHTKKLSETNGKKSYDNF